MLVLELCFIHLAGCPIRANWRLIELDLVNETCSSSVTTKKKNQIYINIPIKLLVSNFSTTVRLIRIKVEFFACSLILVVVLVIGFHVL